MHQTFTGTTGVIVIFPLCLEPKWIHFSSRPFSSVCDFLGGRTWTGPGIPSSDTSKSVNKESLSFSLGPVSWVTLRWCCWSAPNTFPLTNWRRWWRDLRGEWPYADRWYPWSFPLPQLSPPFHTQTMTTLRWTHTWTGTHTHTHKVCWQSF